MIKQNNSTMKKIMIIDGGPRKNFNTAAMLQKFAEGARAASSDIEVKTIRLYALDYKGC
ncbi:MAG: NAD(P)H-dependent oxidoreductase, partial [Bacteroidales bacterium]|nr:NAD(P)H-dependent oxidoreductase [Bacteroidales bacterium]